MDFLCDVHISMKVSKRIEELGHNSTHVNFILNKWNTTDAQITEYAERNNLILITKDQDFRNGFLLNSKPKKLVKINLGNISNKKLSEIIESLLDTIHLIEKNHKTFMIEVYETTSSIITKE